MLAKVWEITGSSVYMFHYLCQDQALAAKSFEKIDKNVKCHFLSFSPTLNVG